MKESRIFECFPKRKLMRSLFVVCFRPLKHKLNSDIFFSFQADSHEEELFTIDNVFFLILENISVYFGLAQPIVIYFICVSRN